MIEGRVSEDLEALIEVDVRAGDGTSRSLEVVLDTGFTGYLVLPQSVINRLGLRFSGQRSVILASGERRAVDAYIGTVSWHGQRCDVIVLESISESLLAMALL